MKTTIFLKSFCCLLMVILFSNGFSQTNVINKTLVVPDSNVLYLGITNAIEIQNNKNPFFEIRSYATKLNATPHSFVYEIYPTRAGWDTIYVYNGDVEFKKAFKIVPLPAIEAKLGTLRKEVATQEEIYINGWLILTIPNCTCKPNYVVSSFVIDFESEEVNADPIEIEGERVTTQARKVIKSLKSGDVVYFDRIMAKNEDGKTIEIPGFSITVE